MNSFKPAFGLDFLDYLEEGIYILDPDRKILFWNRAAEKITGYAKEEVIGSSCMDNILIHVDNRGRCLCKENCPVVEVFADGKCKEDLLYLHHKEGYRLPVSVKAIPIQNERGEITSVIEIFSDRSLQIDELPNVEMKKEPSFVDPVTGFFTQNHLKLKLKSMHAEAAALGNKYGVILINFQNYQTILARHGCDCIDRALRSIAKTLRSLSRASYLLCRWNHDTFLVAIPNSASNAIQLMSAHYQYIVNTAKAPVGDRQVSILVEATYIIPQNEDSFESVVAQLEKLAVPE